VSQIQCDFFVGASHVGGERDVSVVDAANRLNYLRFGYPWWTTPYTSWRVFPIDGVNWISKKPSTSGINDFTDNDLISYRFTKGEKYYIPNGDYLIIKSFAVSGWFNDNPRNLKLQGSTNNSTWINLNLVKKTRHSSGAEAQEIRNNYVLSGFVDNKNTWWTYEITNPGNYKYYKISHDNDEVFEYALFSAPWNYTSLSTTTKNSFNSENYQLEPFLNEEAELKVYPNPIEDTFYVKSTRVVKNLTIISTEGRSIKTLSGIDKKSFEVDASGLSQGTYILKLQMDDASYMSHLIVK